MKRLFVTAAILALATGTAHARVLDLDAPPNPMDAPGAPAHVRLYATPEGQETREIGSNWATQRGPVTLSLVDQNTGAIGWIPDLGVAAALEATGSIQVAIPGRYQFRLRVSRDEIFATHCVASIQIDGLRVLQSAALASTEVMLLHGDHRITVAHECSNDDLAQTGPMINERSHVEIRSAREDWRPLDWTDLGVKTGRED